MQVVTGICVVLIGGYTHYADVAWYDCLSQPGDARHSAAAAVGERGGAKDFPPVNTAREARGEKPFVPVTPHLNRA